MSTNTSDVADKATGIVVAVAEVTPFLERIASAEMSVSLAYDGFGEWYVSDLMPRAGGDYGIARTAVGKAVRSFFLKDIAEDDDAGKESAEKRSKAVLTALHKRLKAGGHVPESKRTEAARADKGQAVQANTKRDKVADLVSKALTLGNAAVGRLRDGDDTDITETDVKAFERIASALTAYTKKGRKAEKQSA